MKMPALVLPNGQRIPMHTSRFRFGAAARAELLNMLAWENDDDQLLIPRVIRALEDAVWLYGERTYRGRKADRRHLTMRTWQAKIDRALEALSQVLAEHLPTDGTAYGDETGLILDAYHLQQDVTRFRTRRQASRMKPARAGAASGKGKIDPYVLALDLAVAETLQEAGLPLSWTQDVGIYRKVLDAVHAAGGLTVTPHTSRNHAREALRFLAEWCAMSVTEKYNPTLRIQGV